MKFYVEILLKTVVMTGLSAVFWLYFCVPSYQTYKDLHTFLAESSTPYQERMMPAVSVWSQEEDTELLYHNIQESATLHFSLGFFYSFRFLASFESRYTMSGEECVMVRTLVMRKRNIPSSSVVLSSLQLTGPVSSNKWELRIHQ